MEVHNSFFSNNNAALITPIADTSAYYPFAHPFTRCDACSLGNLDVASHPTVLLTIPALPQSSDNAFHMQHLRFPTPPITPPHNSVAPHTVHTPKSSVSNSSSSPTLSSNSPARTQSVIMKIAQGHLWETSQHVDMPSNTTAFDVNPQLHREGSINSETSSPKKEEFICDWIDCNRHHESLDSLVAHVTKMHAIASPVDGLYYCRWNGCSRARGFSARYKMLVHARTHTKEKPHQCQLCAKSFSRAENLKIHIRSHSGEKPYLCTYKGCHKAYSNSSDRFKHTRTHAMDKPYMCKVPGCQKRYTDPSSLRKHVKTFKHNVQLIGTGTSAYTSSSPRTVGSAAQATIPPLPPKQNSIIVNRRLSDEQVSPLQSSVMDFDSHTSECELCAPPSYLPATPKQTSHYYLSSMEEDVCHIKATQMDYYYVTASSTTAPTDGNLPSYWIARTPRNHDSGIAMDLETPLDLRLNRS